MSRRDRVPAGFDQLVRALDHPMVVVTAVTSTGPEGCLVGFHCQAGIDPPRYLVMISVNNATHDAASRADRLGVSFLAAEQFELARLFGEESGDWTDKFASCSWHDELGVPVLDGAGGWFVGDVLSRHETGDHTAFVLGPVTAGHRGPPELLSSLVVIGELEPGHDAGRGE